MIHAQSAELLLGERQMEIQADQTNVIPACAGMTVRSFLPLALETTERLGGSNFPRSLA